MSGNSGALNTTLITFIVVVFVVVRFLYRELKARVVKAKTLWVRPAFLVVVSVLLVAASLAVPGTQPAMIVLALVAGVIVGAITGTLVVRFTTFQPTGQPGEIQVLGSTRTVAVWVIALALRFAFRLVFAGGSQTVQFTLNVFTIVLVTAAFAVVALGLRRAIRQNVGGTNAAPPVRRAAASDDD